jgi:hypothetical protein
MLAIPKIVGDDILLYVVDAIATRETAASKGSVV